MLKIRLRRTGKRNQASYRIVVADSKKPRDGAFVDHLGHYNPRLDPPEVVIDEARARDWISKGAQPSEAVQRMLDNLSSDETQEPDTESTDS
ncbi:MAG: 30S ribosomal protein S16 [SAR202 cluster bacterium]|nr:30S ribosomal protein S16 [SAR202 cluster bacterium]MQF68014.1 30S ribosomal protein S16 [SAR202 cluster bacterium AD-802-K11_MRT_200m]|tara:strand:+ start:809 stop:1084 length:276 start_codon:yes stop_codon:yes gene_type:complete